jgi:hypothetical protein
MVSGFFTSPNDQLLILSGDAIEILTAAKSSGSCGFSKKLKESVVKEHPRDSF